MAEWWNQTPVYEFEEPMYGCTNSRSSRDRHTTRRNETLTTSLGYDLNYGSSRRQERSPRPRSERPEARRRNSKPPAPHVEDEYISLAREVGGKRLPHLDEETHNPPAKGEIDQHPILYESELTASEAASTDTLDTILATNHHKREGRGKAQEEWEARQRAKTEEDRSKERRFVLLPKSDTYSPQSEDNELDYYSDLRKPKTPQIIHEFRTPSRERTSEPDTGRRRSRHDLPSLKTDIENAANAQAPPPLERSPKAYFYKPKIKEDLRPARNGLLSPDVGSARPRSRGGDDRPGYFDIPRERVGEWAKVRGREWERDERRRSRPSTPNGGSNQPTTPSLNRASSDFGPRLPLGRQLDPQSAYGRSRRDREAGSTPGSPNTERPVTPNGNGHRRQASRHARGGHHDFDKPRKVATSPLPSPRTERDPYKSRRGETFPPLIHQESRSPRPVSRPSSPYPDSAYPKPYPNLDIAKSKRNSREHSPDRPHTATMPTIPTPTWPPVFNPPASRPPVHGHLDPPTMGSYRRQSVDTESGHIAPLPPCPRTTPTHNAYDWLTLPRCEGFHICPTCYTSNVESTPFRAFFVPRPFMAPAPDGIVCDFGTQPWYRIAWLMLQKNREKDLQLIYRLAEILRTTEECLGPNEAVRDWYGVIDPSTGRLMQAFDVCRSCVEIISAVLPELEGTFKRRAEFEPLSGYGSDTSRGYASGHGSDRCSNGGRRGRKRICDMRFDTSNFIHYFDALELIAEQTPRHLGRYLPDMSLFVEVVKKLAAEAPLKPQHRSTNSEGSTPPKCQGSKELIGASWWVIAQLPEFLVCSECFRDVVKPEAERKRATARMFEVERRERGSCQLYSPRMRKIFLECCANDEFLALAQAARERRKMEREWRENLVWAAGSGFSSGKREDEEDKALKRWWRYE